MSTTLKYNALFIFACTLVIGGTFLFVYFIKARTHAQPQGHPVNVTTITPILPAEHETVYLNEEDCRVARLESDVRSTTVRLFCGEDNHISIALDYLYSKDNPFQMGNHYTLYMKFDLGGIVRPKD